ncbi:DMT family transporter [Neisseria perflava]|uniref:DMT family transporter n=1 Tax=Neisseria perflava TaxID=33053 RepID=UPI002A00889B|nr:multidrug transporter EmrE-like cation transporter [Neisseria perflava]MCP1771617.1 multidrug transporter EmrE-like cation transporter [Neisseria perflava]
MNAWLLLMIAIGFEIAATALLKTSDGFTRLLPTVSSLALYGVSFYCVSLVYRSLPVGIVYAV